jgi:hypothetical protein
MPKLLQAHHPYYPPELENDSCGYPMEDCTNDCPACSGEICMVHDGSCDCDIISRHTDCHGKMFYGRWDGMTPYLDPDEDGD